jgi:molybdenum cofactor biosynthesis enzyme MoaA
MNRYTVNKAVIRNVPVDDLQKLHDIFDNLGCSIDWSLDLGELIVRVGKTFELEMTADPQELKEIYEEEFWAEDAERIAEGYWRE